jgi:four helix bundle protein
VPFDELETLAIYRKAEKLSDRIYDLVQGWSFFDRDTVGKQLVRAADSIGANIAESYGRYHYGDQIRFLYIARGSLYETKFWIRRAQSRQLISDDICANALAFLEDFAAKLNAYIRTLRNKRDRKNEGGNAISEETGPYWFDTTDEMDSNNLDTEMPF